MHQAMITMRERFNNLPGTYRQEVKDMTEDQ
jgi:hypothetical protein